MEIYSTAGAAGLLNVRTSTLCRGVGRVTAWRPATSINGEFYGRLRTLSLNELKMGRWAAMSS